MRHNLHRYPEGLGASCVACSVFRSIDRKSTRLNSSHRCTSYAVFCLKKKSVVRSSIAVEVGRVDDAELLAGLLLEQRDRILGNIPCSDATRELPVRLARRRGRRRLAL